MATPHAKNDSCGCRNWIVPMSSVIRAGANRQRPIPTVPRVARGGRGYPCSARTTEPQSGNGWGFRCSPPDHSAVFAAQPSTRMCDNCEERAMAEHEDIRQPQVVSKPLPNYL